MRLLPITFALLLLLLAACQLPLPGNGAKAPEGANPITGDAIAVTSLDAPRPEAGPEPKPEARQPPPVDPAPQTVPEPLPEPAPAATPDPAPQSVPAADPVARKPPEQIACEKTGGSWALAGQTGTRLCVRPTRDSGKQCRKGTECEGLCLARSGTCAPIVPMFGCNEILQDDGRWVTLCID